MYLFHFCWQHSGPSELGIVFKNHLKLLTQHDVPFGLQFATEEGLQRDRERAPTITLALTPFPRIQSSGHLSFPLTAGVVPPVLHLLHSCLLWRSLLLPFWSRALLDVVTLVGSYFFSGLEMDPSTFLPCSVSAQKSAKSNGSIENLHVIEHFLRFKESAFIL